MSTPQRPSVFIEKIFPIKLLNQQVYYENGGNPFKGLHRWYSRKPLSFSRASVLGSLLPADISLEEFEYLLGLYTEEELKFWENSSLSKEEKEEIRSKNLVKLYKTPPTEKQIQRVQELCERIWGHKTPAILDQFAGGGSIPFEALRYRLNVFASDLNPVAVMIMKAAMEYPLKFGAALQEDIDKWVQWVGEEAQKRLAQFFPSQEGETVQNYLWAHTVVCPNCQSVVPLSPNWWLYKRPEKQNLHKWCAVKPIPNLAEKRIDFELVRGKKGKGTTIETQQGEYDPEVYNTISRGVGKCLCCTHIIEDEVIKSQAQNGGLGHQLYAVAFKQGKGSLDFRIPDERDLDGVEKGERFLEENYLVNYSDLVPDVEIPLGEETERLPNIGIQKWDKLFNPRQLLTLVTYLEIINEAKLKLQAEYEPEKVGAICTYLGLVMDRCVDVNCRLNHWDSSRGGAKRASAQHSLNLMWNYPETAGNGELWNQCVDALTSDYNSLCSYLTPPTIPNTTLFQPTSNNPDDIKINLESADSLYHISNNSIDAIITDPPYYGTLQYAELSDFFYVWQKRTLGDIFPELFYQELTDKDREAVANPSRFRNMGESPDKLAKEDYEAKMSLAWAEAYRVLREEGVLTVQFNHKESGAWDTLAKALIDAGFEITASWAVSTENPQNLHQAKKNSVSSTVILVCRKRNPNAAQAWWDDLRPEVSNLVEQRAPEFEANDITGIDLYLSAFGPALNVFSRSYPILDSVGEEVRPEVAFAEARKAIASYRFRKLVQTDTIGFDTLTQWYLLAWDAFKAREFPFDEARQLALAVGGFNIADLAKTHKLIETKSGECILLSPQQRLKKRAFTTVAKDFTLSYLIDGLHAAIAIYEEEGNLQQVRQFMQKTGLVSEDRFMKTLEVAFKVIPDKAKEKDSLVNIWLGIEEIKAKVTYQQGELF
jgi:adenine-specific DNA methylase